MPTNWVLVCVMGGVGPAKCVQMMILSLVPWYTIGINFN